MSSLVKCDKEGCEEMIDPKTAWTTTKRIDLTSAIVRQKSIQICSNCQLPHEKELRKKQRP